MNPPADPGAFPPRVSPRSDHSRIEEMSRLRREDEETKGAQTRLRELRAAEAAAREPSPKASGVGGRRWDKAPKKRAPRRAERERRGRSEVDSKSG